MEFSKSEEKAGRIPAAYVASWAAVNIDAAGKAAQRFGECAEESIVPAALRRRLGVFGRMAVSCGLSVAASDTSDLVFCSRYGDVDLAYRLLSDLVTGSVMSPAGFSLSVHNAVPGVMDLARKNRIGHTAVAAGTQSLSAGFTEAWAKLAENPEEKIALVYAEAPLPPIYAERSGSIERGLALALTLSAARTEGISGTLTLDHGFGGDAGTNVLDAPGSETLAEKLIETLSAQEADSGVIWRSQGACWTFRAGSHAAD